MSRGGPGVRRVSIRYDKAEGEFEARCEMCAASGQTKAYWPLTLEFWDPKIGLQNCRACHRLRRRLRNRQTAEERRQKARDRYHRNRESLLVKRRQRYMANREEINRKRQEQRAASKRGNNLDTTLQQSDNPR